MCHSSLFLNDGPTAHWIGPKTLVDIVMEGREAITLADISSQVNVMTPTYVKCHEFPVLLLEELVDGPVNLVGLGGGCTSPLGFVILWVHMAEVTGYDEDIVFLIIPDESEFLRVWSPWSWSLMNFCCPQNMSQWLHSWPPQQQEPHYSWFHCESHCHWTHQPLEHCLAGHFPLTPQHCHWIPHHPSDQTHFCWPCHPI